MGQDLVVAALAVFAYMTVVFVVALFKKDNSIVDIAWGPGFILVAALTFLFWPGASARQILANALVAAWGLRLGIHIALRNRGRGEDFRYANWRRAWGRWFVPRSYLQIFLVQGALMLAVAFPVVLINRPGAAAGLGVLDGLGSALWITGFLFEAVGDRQLRVFKRDPVNKGKIMDRGLWRFTRHPNYFGEALMWWGIFVIALAVPGGWRAVVSPVVITGLLLRVSGVTLLEKKYAGNAAYAEYIRRTSAFIPRPPKA
jgi:steroid 5-alpha reductase family enzyme